MNTTSTQKTPDVQINRRHFLAGAGGLTFAIGLSEGLITGAFAQSNDSKASLSAWVTIGYDDTISIMTPTGEMGQGTLTALPLILAEELDADWSRVKPEYAPPNPQIFGNPHPILNGGQATLASIAIPGYFTKMRIAGAQARRILMDAVAQKWNVPLSELSTDLRSY
jgi:isoquinoline 1-oxidoreductase beta subunit